MSDYITFKVRPGSQPLLTPGEYYRVRRQRRQMRQSTSQGVQPELIAIANADNLIDVFNHLSVEAGQAPGPDGFSYADFSRAEVAEIMRTLSKALLQGTYRPSPARQVKIPKTSGQGFRQLSILNLTDRVVAAAVHRALTPIWDEMFLDGSFGFRASRGVWDMLLALESAILKENRLVLAIDDIQNAFDRVPLDGVLKDHRIHFTDAALVDLVNTTLHGGADIDRNQGIPQGHAYSPTVLNVRLHVAHDVPWQSDTTNPPWFRYADNFVYACRDTAEATLALAKAGQLLKGARFSLKCTPPAGVFHLAEGMTASLLGFSLSYQGRALEYSLTDASWRGLERDLLLAHQAPSPPAMAFQAVQGWLTAYGPALKGLPKDIPQRIIQLAKHMGFDEVATIHSLTQLMKTSCTQWLSRRQQALAQ